MGPGKDSTLTEDEDAEVQYRSVQAKEACVLKGVKGTKEIHSGRSSNHNMASDFRVSGRSNKNADGRCDMENAGGSGVLRHQDSSNNLMMVFGSAVLRHLDSSIDAMDLVERGFRQGTLFL